MIRTAAILARGLGTRMRRLDATAQLDHTQAAVADSGMKGMIPIANATGKGIARPFLDYVISALADAGISRVVLVLGPEHDAVRDYYSITAKPARVSMSFAIQAEPLGTANAVVAAADAIGHESFIVINADNYYPVEALARLAQSESAATIAFDRDALVRDGNIDRDRVRAFAVLAVSSDGQLTQIIEKPGDRIDLKSDAARWVGMNCWVVTPELADACRRVPKSVRGEFELPEAVGLALSEGMKIRAERVALPVLDLSSRNDIASVNARLSQIAVRP